MYAITEQMAIAPSTATAMMKHLRHEGLVHYMQRKGVELTDKGRGLALYVLRRHRLVEAFLADVLKYDWSEVHADAEQLEHVVSDTFIDKIEAHMDYPVVDPHGSPIPTKDGTLLTDSHPAPRTLLAHAQVGGVYRIQHITRDSAGVAKECADHGLRTEAVVKVLKKNIHLDVMRIEIVDLQQIVDIGLKLASLILLQEYTRV